MALFKIFKGSKDDLGVTGGTDKAYDGYAYFTPDNGKFYIDVIPPEGQDGDPVNPGINRIPLSADKADRDDLGNIIKNTYAANLNLAGHTLKLIAKDGTTVLSTITLPDELVKQTAKTDNAEYKILTTSSTSPTSGNAAEAAYDTDITLNPSTNTITATNFAGNATTATTLKNSRNFSIGSASKSFNGSADVSWTVSTEDVIKTITFTAGSTPTLGTAFSIPNVTGNTSVTASKVTKSDNTVVKTISQASSTSSVIGTVANGILTFSQAITAVGAVTAGSTATASAVTITDVTATNTSLGTAFSVPNVTDVGTAPTLTTTTQNVITGIS